MNPLTTKIVEAIKEKAYDMHSMNKPVQSETDNGFNIEMKNGVSILVDETDLTAAIDKVLEREGKINNWDFEDEDEADDEFDFEDYEEREFERAAERAATCLCGAWQLINGKVVHVADCCCGAD